LVNQCSAIQHCAAQLPNDTDGTSRIWLAGGYDSTGVPVSSMEIFECTLGGDITLTATVKHKEGGTKVILTWSPANGGDMDVLVNGKVVHTTADDGMAMKNVGARTGTATFQVCEPDTGICSNVVEVTLR
jgi:hypothetical protein